ncbi:MAG TPA: TraR/DksA C4-type zinc finger protein [Candidatus Cybelea sp.]|nr:TraR/DksA C4-type zinc finger protein [Candidatus Cybelea sp.]
MKSTTDSLTHNGRRKKYGVFEDLLRKKRDALRQKLNYRLDDVTIQLEPNDEGDMAARNFAKDLAVATIERERRELAEIEAALERMTRGEYGLCETCQNPIREARLHALPWARFCIQCADRSVNRAAD